MGFRIALALILLLSQVVSAGDSTLVPRAQVVALDQRRETIVKALLLLRFSNWRDGKQQQTAFNTLKAMGIEPSAARRLIDALGALYEGPPVSQAFPIPGMEHVTVAEYDRRLSAAAQAAGLGTDFIDYLRSHRPALLEGRLKASDAASPEFLEQNIPILKELTQKDLWPLDTHPGHLYNEALTANIEKLSPLIAKNKSWRSFVRETLTHGSLQELRTFSGAVGDKAVKTFRENGPYSSLVWGLGDIYQEAEAQAAGNPTREAALREMSHSFPSHGMADFAREALAPQGFHAGDRHIPDWSNRTLDSLEGVSSPALEDFYHAMEEELRPDRKVSLEAAERIVDWIKKRFGYLRSGSAEDIRLLGQILPRAFDASIRSRTFDIQADLAEIQEKIGRTPSFSIEERQKLINEISRQSHLAASQPELQNKIAELLKSSHPEDVSKGLALIKKTSIGVGSLEIQDELARLASEAHDPKAHMTREHYTRLQNAIDQVLEPETKISGALFREAERMHLGHVDLIRPTDVSYDSELYETALTSARPREDLVKHLASLAPADDPLKALGPHLKSAGPPAQKYVLQLLESENQEEIRRGLRLVANTTIAGNSVEVQRQLVKLFPQADHLPLIMSGYDDNREIFLRVLLPETLNRNAIVTDPSVVKLILSLEKKPSDGWYSYKDELFKSIDPKKVPHDPELKGVFPSTSSAACFMRQLKQMAVALKNR